MPQYFKEHGERLVELGYRIVPLPPGEKGPNRKGWPRFELTAQSVRKMAAKGSAHDGIGILAATTPAIDVDILDEEVAQQMSDEIDRIFAGQSLMTRTGRAPKFLIPFRSDEPFRKLTSKVYSDGKHEHKVEVLGDGQQWVAYHVHPDTGRPYVWFDGISAGGIVECNAADLAVLTRIDAQRVIDAFEVLAQRKVQSGAWTAVSGRKTEPGNGAPPTDDPFDDQPVGKTEQEVARLLARHPNNEADYDHWFAVLAAVNHELGDAGRELAYEWSSSSSKHVDEVFAKKWESLGRYTGRMITLRSLMKEDRPERPALPNSGFVPASQFASAQRVEWHIKHVLPKRGLIVIYGEPGSSKSFFALDMVAHVARGLPWRGHKVRQANVAYIAAEGVAGFGNRLAAYAKHNGITLDDLPVFVRGGAFELKEDYLPACDEINAIGSVGLVVIDTLAAVTPGGNENTSEDMGAAIDAAQRIIEATGASVILIHHTNNQGALRGWSGLRGAVDNQVRIENKDGLRTAHIEKQKEGQDGTAYGYRLKVVELYTDEDGDAVTSCAVVEDAQTAPNTRGVKKERSSTAGDFEHSRKNMHGRRYLEIIADLGGLGDANVDIGMIIEAAQSDELLNTSGEPDNPTKRSITRSIDRLGEKGKIRREGRWIRLC
jgi:AAA domain/Primase C terminal 2 (PriCT-2)/Bifunctional DNA primase/polymerase, N-terminal